MPSDLRSRCKVILQPDCGTFNPLPSAACLLDPKLAPVMFSSDMCHVLNAARLYIISLEAQSESTTAVTLNRSEEVSSDPPVGLKRFAFLSAKLNASQQVTVNASNQDNLVGQLNRYMTGAGQEEDTSGSGLEYWSRNRHLYTKLAPIAQDLLSAPASQAYIERIFSLCGVLTSGRRNRMTRSLSLCF